MSDDSPNQSPAKRRRPHPPRKLLPPRKPHPPRSLPPLRSPHPPRKPHPLRSPRPPNPKPPQVRTTQKEHPIDALRLRLHHPRLTNSPPQTSTADPEPAAAPEPEPEPEPEAAPAPVPDANSSPSPAKGAGKPVRQYLDDTVVPVLRKGLRELVKQRPEDPFEFLAEFIKSNKPKTSD